MPVRERRRDVLLIGGASGTGKTSVSYRVAREHGVGITEFDDVVEALKAMTTPDQQPALHCWAPVRKPGPAALGDPAGEGANRRLVNAIAGGSLDTR